jgi:hypothetical protein
MKNCKQQPTEQSIVTSDCASDHASKSPEPRPPRPLSLEYLLAETDLSAREKVALLHKLVLLRYGPLHRAKVGNTLIQLVDTNHFRLIGETLEEFSQKVFGPDWSKADILRLLRLYRDGLHHDISRLDFPPRVEVNTASAELPYSLSIAATGNHSELPTAEALKLLQALIPLQSHGFTRKEALRLWDWAEQNRKDPFLYFVLQGELQVTCTESEIVFRARRTPPATGGQEPYIN